MSAKTLTRSFAGGVITPEMWARLDLAKNQTGLAEADNFEVLPHGPLANRSGFAYVIEVKDSTKAVCLIAFVYSTTQSMVLEFGNLYVRFHTEGGTLLEASKNIAGITQASPGVLNVTAHGYTTGEWVFITGILVGPTKLNGRFFKVVVSGANNFSLTGLDGVAISTAALIAWAAGGTVARVYEIASPYLEADLFDIHHTQSLDVLTLVHPSYQQRELRRLGATNWAFSLLTLTPGIDTPVAPGVVASGGSGKDYTYVATAVAESTLEESFASPEVTVSNDITIAGNVNTITPATVAGAVRYNVYRKINGLFGFIGQTDGDDVIDENIVPDTSRTPPLADNIMASADAYPQAVGYFQQRRWFGGPNNDPQRVFASKSATESNFTYSIPTRDDDRISLRVAGRRANTVRHIVPIEEVIVLTSDGVFVMQGDNTTVLTGNTVVPRPKPGVGASNAQPVVTASSVVYGYDRGNRVREFAFRGDTNGGYRGIDLSELAPHLFDKYVTRQFAYAEAPYPTVWLVRNDGALLGCTYVPEQTVAGWHPHSTQGAFESICVVPEGRADVLYAVVARTINGREVRYIERKYTRLFNALEDCFFLDCGTIYTGAATNTLDGLEHLEGATVNALAGGAVFRNLTVTDGRLTLPDGLELTPIVVGLQITARFKTLPLAWEAAALGQGMAKNINQIWARVNESSGMRAGPTFDALRGFKQRTTEPYGSPPRLVTDEIEFVLTPAWSQGGHLCVEQIDPLPLTVQSLVMEVATGG